MRLLEGSARGQAAAGSALRHRRGRAQAILDAETRHPSRVRPRHDQSLRPDSLGALLRDGAARARLREGLERRDARRVEHVLPHGGGRERGEAGHAAAPPRLPVALARARGRVLAGRHRGRLPERRRARARGPSTAATTTAPSSWIRTGTAPRPPTTAACAARGRSTTSGCESRTSRARRSSTRPSPSTRAST